MIILTIRTDNPEAELGLYNGENQLAYKTWTAHRQLAETIHQQIATLLHSVKKDWNDIQGIVCFKGPGSFTGLRIGLTVGNALAYSLGIPIVSHAEENWKEQGTRQLQKGKNEKVAMPDYGSPVHTTIQRK